MNRHGQITLGQIYYNTTLFRFDEDSIHGGWDVAPNPNLVPPMTGWGLGAIYNSAHRGGYLFADIDPNQKSGLSRFLRTRCQCPDHFLHLCRGSRLSGRIDWR